MNQFIHAFEFYKLVSHEECTKRYFEYYVIIALKEFSGLLFFKIIFEKLKVSWTNRSFYNLLFS